MKTQSVSLTTNTTTETQNLAELIGQHATPGTIITLNGDLGSGKTSFVQGLAKGLDIPNDFYITSPTYNIINEYPGRLPLYHIDLYRLHGADELTEIGFYDIINGNGVTAIEWPGNFTKEIGNISIDIHLQIVTENCRNIAINIYAQQFLFLL